MEQCRVKICGITSVEDAQMVVSAGAYALGLNLIPQSKRFIDIPTARSIIDAVRGRAELVAVVADRTAEETRALSRELPGVRFQLHGFEPVTLVAELSPLAFKAMRIGGEEDVRLAERCPGEPLLVDARVPGELGGTGQSFDWNLVVELAKSRPMLLAGGLTPDNVGDAVRAVRPWGVDVASGVEVPKEPRRKDPAQVGRFLDAVRQA